MALRLPSFHHCVLRVVFIIMVLIIADEENCKVRVHSFSTTTTTTTSPSSPSSLRGSPLHHRRTASTARTRTSLWTTSALSNSNDREDPSDASEDVTQFNLKPQQETTSTTTTTTSTTTMQSQMEALQKENQELRAKMQTLQQENEQLQAKAKKAAKQQRIVLENFEGEFSGKANVTDGMALALLDGDDMEEWCAAQANPNACPIEPTVSFGEALRDRAVWLVGLLMFQSASGIILAQNEALLEKHPVSECSDAIYATHNDEVKVGLLTLPLCPSVPLSLSPSLPPSLLQSFSFSPCS